MIYIYLKGEEIFVIFATKKNIHVYEVKDEQLVMLRCIE